MRNTFRPAEQARQQQLCVGASLLSLPTSHLPARLATMPPITKLIIARGHSASSATLREAVTAALPDAEIIEVESIAALDQALTEFKDVFRSSTAQAA